MTRARVVLADDHPVVLAGIKALLQATPDVDVVGEATSGAEALERVRVLQPDVAVLDISLPDMTGVELARRLAADCPAVRLLALTAHEDRAYLQQMLAAGSHGYLLKRSAADELARAVRAVAAGGVYLDPAIAELALAGLATPGRTAADPGLSPREEDVLRHTAWGLSNKEIAGRLELSAKTVETYKARALEKLGLRSRSDIVRFGAAQGWLQNLDDGLMEPKR
ncbi:response regulator transcription factor (plasmid) [Lichenicola cladoniae]|uniref:Response regulator transcription factor n=1 Tax=Lichenicola cladoniae TaxID=1484109 RepID=A0A6M8HXW1_9PROT|nr:response regulator transcription factor [Lichenicola cladoniae]NPD68962.1 response regulator transcription factor [Acetobacteraceae bacterium]QKE93242.1 response regulator transcription factor [Lichenicola cladoniae]